MTRIGHSLLRHTLALLALVGVALAPTVADAGRCRGLPRV
jgi:hypothetical protein